MPREPDTKAVQNYEQCNDLTRARTFGALFTSAFLPLAVFLALVVFAQEPARAESSSISANFNGTAVPASDDLWFNSVIKLTGTAPTSPLDVFITGASISFTANSMNYSLSLPNSEIIFTPGGSDSASTAYSSSSWLTNIGGSNNILTENTFMTGGIFAVPSPGLPGGIQNVTFTADFTASAAVNLNWQWAAAAYTSMNTPDTLNVKPSDDANVLFNGGSVNNSDHAGTPECCKSNVTGGGTGGGGSNYTGSYSATASVAIPGGGGGGGSVPEPSPALLIGSGLLGVLGLTALRRARRAASMDPAYGHELVRRMTGQRVHQ